MFFRQIRRSAAKNRKNNSLFFGTLVAAIVAFYTLLSLESQDVIRFLKTLESDAIERLMLLIPVVYAVSLFFVFFLVYFAYRYQMDGRRKEFGLYLMLGMGRGRLFAMLMGQPGLYPDRSSDSLASYRRNQPGDSQGDRAWHRRA